MLRLLSLNLCGHGSDVGFGAVGIDGHGHRIDCRIDNGSTSRHPGHSAQFLLIASDEINERNLPRVVVEFEHWSADRRSRRGFSFPLSHQLQPSFEYNSMTVKRARIGQDLLNRRHHIGGQALEAGSKEHKEYHSISNRVFGFSYHGATPTRLASVVAHRAG